MRILNETQFKEISDYIRRNFGINLKSSDRHIFANKFDKFLNIIKANSFEEGYHRILNDRTGECVRIFLDIITINHTFFMREPEHFYYFRDEVLPYLKSTIKDNDLRIWCAACSSGEEAYTIAMILDEFFMRDDSLWERQVLATDISCKVLNKAVRGVYSAKEIQDVMINWKINYFKKIDSNNFEVRKEIKDNIIYRRFNLMEEVFPFKKKFHVIFCRNVMMYFDKYTKKRLIKKFYDNTEKGGYLFIGHSEGIDIEDIGYKYVMPAVYRK
ncbi:chemotaxis protein methyltransferase CheR [Clostridium acetobutylicum]|uniref:protein-glutamate O-methyltransferase n=1 Tax=Clostridium acetobutylicum (strain ATCC 824 / DSM 792 / JCM 1419 / IAM 19013 / LMG 5710 / NBRC 13948 / NRRL B-527 / VKM B-1787 / 2291 / W) TaxID=272562 RepID=Q97MS0_CLOAB|nr:MULTISPECIES: protein-glutamate O-methyltransferase CheR [Clostridium]AAK78106.1 Chemotaxis protein methyltransferase (cheR) [Clostridium acetobutylicum ATCC 824]ADZ19165.1 Chemotaxis protein methyltransferase (cheR) [Clostridium acetobutylicum EA 2018]AEI34672.1 chemotaxis protein methyltransferase [Clostridium acetobutylicum DSM 1731]AWV81832.1 protein-glutamate O-methyltransferase CheR [Clostridium acetobutylicum]MBC2395379.1 protein-glutamate O-methyltransferase CheR [Clostridium acetob